MRTDEINAAAKKFRPSYQVSRQQVDFYRKRLGVKIEELEQASEQSALKRGFALVERRVEALTMLAEKMEEELLGENMLYVDDVKIIGTGKNQKKVEFEVFNSPEVQAFRGVLDDLAKETGGRRQKVDHKVDDLELLSKLLGVSRDELPTPVTSDA